MRYWNRDHALHLVNRRLVMVAQELGMEELEIEFDVGPLDLGPIQRVANAALEADSREGDLAIAYADAYGLLNTVTHVLEALQRIEPHFLEEHNSGVRCRWCGQWRPQAKEFIHGEFCPFSVFPREVE